MTSRIEGQRLDVVLQRLRETDAPNAVTELEQLLPPTRKKETGARPAANRSAEAQLVDYIMPLISDPSIFQDHNSIMLLEHLRDEVLPGLHDDPELTELAIRVIDDEVARHQLVRERRMSGIAS